jgi:hypothetical protein
MLKNISIVTLSVLALLAVSPAQAQEWGTLKGQFVYDGTPPEKKAIQAPGVTLKEPIYDETLAVDPKTKGVGNIVIYVRTKDVKVHPDYAKTEKDTVKYDNTNFRFQPRVLAMQLSQTLELTNSDAVSHNSNFQPIGDEGINPLIPAGGKVQYKANREQTIPQPVGCNIHPWMRGYILVRKSPYAVVTGADGTFELKNLPVGDVELQIWHEKPGFLVAKPEWERGRVTVKIKAGENTLGDGVIKVDPKLFADK